jgi:hypothetical protein
MSRIRKTGFDADPDSDPPFYLLADLPDSSFKKGQVYYGQLFQLYLHSRRALPEARLLKHFLAVLGK